MEVTSKFSVTKESIQYKGTTIPFDAVAHIRFINHVLDGGHYVHFHGLDRNRKALFKVRPPAFALWGVARITGRILAAHEYISKVTAARRFENHVQNLEEHGHTKFHDCTLHSDGTVKSNSGKDCANFIKAKDVGIFGQGVQRNTNEGNSTSGGSLWISETKQASREVGWTAPSDPSARIVVVSPEIDGDILLSIFDYVESRCRSQR